MEERRLDIITAVEQPTGATAFGKIRPDLKRVIVTSLREGYLPRDLAKIYFFGCVSWLKNQQ